MTTGDAKSAGKSLLQRMGANATALASILGLLSILIVGLRQVDNFSKDMSEIKTDVSDMKSAVDANTESLTTMSRELGASRKPDFIEFRGNGQIVEQNGRCLTLIYSLRRNISCDTDVQVSFYNVDLGYPRSGPITRATKSPVSDQFRPFKIEVCVPDNIPPGRYFYQPELVPLECGIYGPVTATPSHIFTIGAGDD